MKITKYETRLKKVGSLTVPIESVQWPGNAVRVFKHITKDLPTERVMALYLDGTNKICGLEMLAKGGKHGCALRSRDVFQGALIANASAVVIGHNHPSGDPKPSPEDVAMTRAVQRAGEILGIPLLDHVIVTRESWYSFSEEGLLDELENAA